MSNVCFQRVEAEVRHLKETCFWAGSNYWTTRIPNTKTSRTRTVIKVAYLAKSEWFAFLCSKFHPEVKQIFRSFTKGEVRFYTEPINQFMNFSVWCICALHLESSLAQLRSLARVEIEFVVPQTKKGLRVPAPFKEMGLEFFEVGKPC